MHKFAILVNGKEVGTVEARNALEALEWWIELEGEDFAALEVLRVRIERQAA